MRRFLSLFLLLIAALPLMGSFVIEEILFNAPFSITNAELIEASGFSLGQEISHEDLSTATGRIQSYLSSKGRPFASVPNPLLIPLEGNRVRLEYGITERIPSDNCRLEFQGLRYFSRAKLFDLLLLPPDKALPVSSLNTTMSRILELYNSRGYLFAKVNLDSLVLMPDSSLLAVIRIREGKPFRPTRYLFEGNIHTRGTSLVRTAGLNSLKQIGPDELETAAQRILNKPYIKTAELIPLDENSLLIRVGEGRMTYLEGVAGLSRSENRTRITGLLNLQFLNLWGSDRALRLNWRQLPNSSSDLKLSYHDSGLERYPFAADLSFARAQQDSLWIRSKAGIDLYYYRLAHQLGLELSAESVIPGYGRPPAIEKSELRSVGGFWNYALSDHRSNPTRGLQLGLRYRIFPGAEWKKPDNALELNGETWIPLKTRWVLALGSHWRSLNHSDPKDYMLYAMGGYQSLRGYREDEFRSNKLGWANLELRYRLSRESRVFIFFDQGLLSFGEKQWKSDIFALGTGLKLGTKLGILSLEYGLGYNGNSLNPIGLGMVHAGLDTSF